MSSVRKFKLTHYRSVLVARKRVHRKKTKVPMNPAIMNDVLARGFNDLMSIIIIRRLGINWTDLFKLNVPE